MSLSAVKDIELNLRH